MRIGKPYILFAAICLSVSGLLAETDPVSQASTLWSQMRRSDVNSAEFINSRNQLISLIDSLAPDAKVSVATTLMSRTADPSINAAALELFGPSGLPIEELQKILENPDRSWPQRVLIRTYYSLLQPEYEMHLNDKFRRQLVAILAQRLERLSRVGEISYGEQRLLSQAIQSALGRYAWKQNDVPEMQQLVSAMRAFSSYPRVDEVLSPSINGWLNMVPNPKIDSDAEAIKNLGHWDPLVRVKSATFLANKMRTDQQIGQEVLKQLKDPRDEVQASATSVFSYALSYEPKKIIPIMVNILLENRSVPAQKMAAESLIAHSEEAQLSASLLLEALESRRPKPGPMRTESILTTLSYLVHDQTPPSIKQRLLTVAVKNLEFAPMGALRALEAMGPSAASALPEIKQYRKDKADRFTRQYIDTHVLEAIEPQD